MSAKGKGKPSLQVDRIDQKDRGRNVHVQAARKEAANLNHLLGFSLPPRQRQQASAGRKPSKAVPYTRERFVHASYRFVLNPTGDYTAHFCDPDIYHCWPNVLQVIVSCDTSPSNAATLADREEQENFCPICLSEPSAPRMTKCGHVFCYPCLLHLFELSDHGKWVKCPVCADTIHPKDLKSVTFAQPAEACVPADVDFNMDGTLQGDFVTLQLMERPRITTLALPRSATWPSEAVPHLSTPWVFSPDAYTFARFMLATPEYMLAALQQDLLQLNAITASIAGIKEAELDGSFVAAAVRKVREQMDKAEGLKTNHVMAAKKQSARDIAETQERSRKHAERAAKHLQAPQASTSTGSSSEEIEEIPDIYYASSAQGGQYQRHVPGAAVNSSTQTKTRKNLNPPPPDNTFYFYQASSGANVFLHPLDIKILKAHYINYPAFPDTIHVRVEGREEGSMNEDLRRRCRYLSHLPAASDVTFLELDLERLIGSKSLEPYAHALKTRRTKRKDKLRREDKAKFRSEEKEREKNERDFRTTIHHSARDYVFHPSESAHLVIPHHYPEIDDDAFPSMSPPSPSVLPADATERDRTVWGTRLIPNSALPPSAAPPEADDWDVAFRTWEAQVASTTPVKSDATAPPKSSGKKKKQRFVLDLGVGGARGAR